MKFRVAALLVLLGSASFAFSSAAVPAHEQVQIPSFEFSLQLYKTLRASYGDKDVFFSPWSVSIGLTMLLNGACCDTATELFDVLGYTSQDLEVVNANARSMFDSLQGNQGSYELEGVNAVYVNQSFPLKQGYVDALTQNYNAPPEQEDFTNNNEGARQKINHLVDVKTRNLIPEFIPRGALSRSTVLYLLNVIYFNGIWEKTFPKRDTKPEQFTTIKGRSVKVPMMRLETSLHNMYDSDLDSDCVILPYKGSRLHMALLVPRTDQGIVKLEEKLTTSNLKRCLELNNRPKFHRPEEIILYMPKFDTEATYKMENDLQKMGIRRAFAGGNFSKLTDAPVAVSSVSHKAVLKVHEEGSEAAAATGIGVVFTSLQPSRPHIIRADKPFMLFIYDTQSDAILFTGALLDPKNIQQ